jgi:GNAT superfamily N-acetyltransferase
VNEIIEIASQFEYNSFQYIDMEDITEGKIYINDDKNIFIYQKADIKKELYWTSKSADNLQLYWASKSKESFFEGLNKTINYIKRNETKAGKIYMEFIPEDFLDGMNSCGFSIVSEWADFWNRDLSLLEVMPRNSVKIRSLRSDEISIASKVTRSCLGCSRGFTGESDDMISEWIKTENANIFAAEIDGAVAGLCFTMLYGFESEKGTVLWIRELVVDPKYQSRGIGRELMSHGIMWGKENGAKRSFLACDSENFNAIKLYESFNYVKNDGRGQINMELKL